MAHPHDHALERHGHGGARQSQDHGAWRSHRQFRLQPDPLRGGLQPFLARPEREPRRRHDLHPGALRAGDLLPRLHGGPPDRSRPGELPPGSGWRRSVLLSAPLADARLLAVPHRVHGPRTAAGDLSGAVHEIHARTRHHRRDQLQGLGVHGRRRDGRAGICRAPFHWRPAKSPTIWCS